MGAGQRGGHWEKLQVRSGSVQTCLWASHGHQTRSANACGAVHPPSAPAGETVAGVVNDVVNSAGTGVGTGVGTAEVTAAVTAAESDEGTGGAIFVATAGAKGALASVIVFGRPGQARAY